MTDPTTPPKKRKTCLWVCFFAWIALALSGYSVYQYSVKRFYRDTRESIGRNIRTAGSEFPCRKAIDTLRDLDLNALSANIDLGDKKEMDRSFDKIADKFPQDASITLLNKAGAVLAHREKKPAVAGDITPLAEVGKIDVALAIPSEGAVFTILSIKLIYFDNEVGGIRILLPSEIESPLKNYLVFFLLWTLLAAPALIGVGLFLSVVAGRVSRKRKTRQADEKKARDALQLFFQLQALYKQKDSQENTFGHYVLSELIAKGGMAELFIAKKVGQYGFEKTVVLKKILPHLADQAEFISMFIEEAKRSAILDHSNIVRTDDFGEIVQKDEYGREKKEYFISMEFVRGKNLQELLKERRRAFPLDASCFIAAQVCRGLEYAHQKGIIHRDISPHNIMISFGGDAKITDFGISKASTDINLTQTGVIKGHLGYMSPEQIQAKELCSQTDIYSLGIVFYEMLSGRRLYKFGSIIEAVNLIPTTEIPPIKKVVPAVQNDLNQIVMKCLEKDLSKRFRDIGEVAEKLEEHMRDATVVYSRSDLAKFMKQNFKETPIAQTTGAKLEASLVWRFSNQLINGAVANVSPPDAPQESAG